MKFLLSLIDRFLNGPTNSFFGHTYSMLTKEQQDELVKRLGFDDLRSLQRFYGLTPDGVYGPATNGVAEPIWRALDKVPGSLRPWRLTKYFVVDSNDFEGPQDCWIVDRNGKELGVGSANFFSNLALEGTGILSNGVLVNVDGGQYVPVDGKRYSSVARWYADYCMKMEKVGRTPKPSRYFGISLGSDGQVSSVQPFLQIPADKVGSGYGLEHGTPKVPFKTLAADIGAYATSEPRFRGKGGLVPIGTRVFVLEFVGMKLPDGSIHDGWCIVNDTGGGIYGAHFDVFVGPSRYQKTFSFEKAHVYFEGIDDRVSVGYSYGLEDK